MIVFCYFFFLTGFTFLYILFLYRILIGIRHVSSTQQHAREILENMVDKDLPTITVVLPVRNEEENIRRCLQSVIAQDYPKDKLQIIVVDDSSEDNTMKFVENFVQDDSKIQLLYVKRKEGEQGGKKPLIARAIAQSCSEIIITTDADCTHDPKWIRSMAAQFHDDVAFVSGPVVYRDRSTRFFRMQALEFLSLVGIGAGFIGIGYPRLCNGANIAYRKSAFEKVGGYSKADASSSGDDEFLMHKIYYSGKTVLFNPLREAIVSTQPAKTVKHFVEQRKRWASKGKQYSDNQFVVFLVALFVYFSLMFFSPLFIFHSSIACVLVIFFLFVKWTTDAAVIHVTSRLFAVPINMIDFLLAELLHVPYIFIISLLGTFTSFEWKNRALKK